MRSQYETGFDEPYKSSNSISYYSFDKRGRLLTVVDSMSGTKTTYDYDDKGFAIRIATYKSDTLRETKILDRQKNKILFQSGQDRGHYVVDKHDRIIEWASYAAGADSVVYKEVFTYDENSMVKSWYLTNGNDTMKIHFTNTVTQRDKIGNCILYNSISDNVMNAKTIWLRKIQYR